MRIAIIDADLIGRKRHRLPTLVCMKLAGYHKEHGDSVDLKLDYEGLERYDRVFLSRVFTDTPVPARIVDRPNVVYGGTGFFYDRAEPLPEAVEHHMPDYHLYNAWVQTQLVAGRPRNEFRYYLDYSIFETYRMITNPEGKPKTRKQIVRWLQSPYTDGAEYRLWGNGVALPVVFFIMAGIAWADGLDGKALS